MHKKVFRFVYALNYVFQVGFCMLTPAALFILGGWYLTNHCGVGKWALIVSIVLGIVCGMYSMFRFLLTSAYSIDPTHSEQKGDTGSERKS